MRRFVANSRQKSDGLYLAPSLELHSLGRPLVRFARGRQGRFTPVDVDPRIVRFLDRGRAPPLTDKNLQVLAMDVRRRALQHYQTAIRALSDEQYGGLSRSERESLIRVLEGERQRLLRNVGRTDGMATRNQDQNQHRPFGRVPPE